MKESMSSRVKPWFAAYQEKYQGESPDFIDVGQIEPVSQLCADFDTLVREVDQLLEDNDLIEYFEEYIQQPRASWKTLNLKTLGFWGSNIRHTSYIRQWLLDNPSVINCSISKLDGNSQILPHCGLTNVVWRCHVGIRIPSENVDRCGIRVNDSSQCWREGRGLAFLDSNQHEVWNHTSGERIIIMFDVLRPQFASRKGYIISRLFLMYAIAKSAGILRMNWLMNIFRIRQTKYLIGMMAYLCSPAIMAYVRIRNKGLPDG